MDPWPYIIFGGGREERNYHIIFQKAGSPAKKEEWDLKGVNSGTRCK